MFITRGRAGYNRHGEQYASGLFLILVMPERDAPPFLERDEAGRLAIRACVRHVRMTQSGHFMTAFAPIGAHRAYLSGTYGADGGTCDVPREVWERCVPLPAALVDAWNKGGGHNSAGSEGPDIRAWALENLKALRAAGTAARKKGR